jgi:uracil-DNA glycosylase
MATLTAFAAALRSEMGPTACIPDFDPWDGAIRAEVLFLLEAPGPRAVKSGFVSRDNPDETAKNFFELNQEAGIPRRRTVTWNVVPWYIGNTTAIRPATRADVANATPALERLLALLPDLKAVTIVGRQAERAIPTIQRIRPDLRLFRSLHPSPKVVNTKPGNRARIVAALGDVAAFLQDLDRAV